MKEFKGKVLFLDRNDINTDEIIPAKYLTEITKLALKPYCLEDLKLPGFDAKNDLAGKGAIITRANFGCGSSREHAPWALEVNGINLVLAENFARIFRQNMYNCGMLAIELPKETLDKIFSKYTGKETTLTADVEKSVLTFETSGVKETIPFILDGFDRALILSNGWVGYADKHY